MHSGPGKLEMVDPMTEQGFAALINFILLPQDNKERFLAGARIVIQVGLASMMVGSNTLQTCDIILKGEDGEEEKLRQLVQELLSTGKSIVVSDHRGRNDAMPTMWRIFGRLVGRNRKK